MITLDSQSAGRLTLAATCPDNPIACRLLKAQLERANLQVETTTNGEEATTAWETHGPGYFRAAMFDHRRPEALQFLSFKAHATSQTCLCAMVSKLLDGYESSKWNADTRFDYQVSPLFVTPP